MSAETRRYYRTTVTRQTGRRITGGHADDLGLGFESGHTVWYTVCEDHNQCTGHATLAVAKSWASEPMTWCEVCNGNDSPDAHDNCWLAEA